VQDILKLGFGDSIGRKRKAQAVQQTDF